MVTVDCKNDNSSPLSSRRSFATNCTIHPMKKNSPFLHSWIWPGVWFALASSLRQKRWCHSQAEASRGLARFRCLFRTLPRSGEQAVASPSRLARAGDSRGHLPRHWRQQQVISRGVTDEHGTVRRAPQCPHRHTMQGKKLARKLSASRWSHWSGSQTKDPLASTGNT